MSKAKKIELQVAQVNPLERLQQLVLETRTYYNVKYHVVSASTRDLSTILKDAKKIAHDVKATRENMTFIAGVAGGIDAVPQGELCQLMMTAMSIIGIPKKTVGAKDKGSSIYFQDLLAIHDQVLQNPDHQINGEKLGEKTKRVLEDFSKLYKSIADPALLEACLKPNGLNSYLLDLPFIKKVDLLDKLFGFFNGGQMQGCLNISSSVISPSQQANQKDLGEFLKIIRIRLSPQLTDAKENLKTAQNIADGLLIKIKGMFDQEEKVGLSAANSLGEAKKKTKKPPRNTVEKLKQENILRDSETPSPPPSVGSPLSQTSSDDFMSASSFHQEPYIVPVTYLLPIDHPETQRAYGLIPSPYGMTQLIGYPQLPVNPALDQRNIAILPVTYHLSSNHPDAQFCYGLMEREDWQAQFPDHPPILRAESAQSMDSRSTYSLFSSGSGSVSTYSGVVHQPSPSPIQKSATSISETINFTSVTLTATLNNSPEVFPVFIDKEMGFCLKDQSGKHQILRDVESNAMEVYKGTKKDLLTTIGTLDSLFSDKEDDKDFIKITSMRARLENGETIPITIHDNTLAIMLGGQARIIGPDLDRDTSGEPSYKLVVGVPAQRQVCRES